MWRIYCLTSRMISSHAYSVKCECVRVQSQFRRRLATAFALVSALLCVFVVRSAEPRWRLFSGDDKQSSLFESEAEFLQTDALLLFCPRSSSGQTLSFVSDYRPTHRTVERDVKRIYSKTGHRNRKQLTHNCTQINDI